MLSRNVDREPVGINVIAAVISLLEIQRGKERIHDTGPGQHLPDMIGAAPVLPYINEILQCTLRQILIGIIAGKSVDGK